MDTGVEKQRLSPGISGFWFVVLRSWFIDNLSVERWALNVGRLNSQRLTLNSQFGKLPSSFAPAQLSARLSLLAGVLLLAAFTGLRAFADPLADSFRTPPDAARPGVLWFWINGNISSNGITADLEAMRRVGLGSVLIMEVTRSEPTGPVPFMGQQWRGLFKHTLAEARRLGLEVNMSNSAGWEGSGGPWITPEQSMQELVWTETTVTGPQRFEGKLLQPEAPSGFYRDVAALAFPSGDEYRLPDITKKAAYSNSKFGRLHSSPPTKNNNPFTTAIARESITPLSAQIDSAGRLVWDVPAGQWTILRLGHTSTGVKLQEAPASGQGLNCDKLSCAGIEANFAGMLAKLVTDTGLKPDELKTSGLVATHIDSWENGAQNWTAKMGEEFLKRRGYDLLPYLPVMTGRVVGSPDISERFLRDLRQTVSELVIENYAGRMRELSNAHGLRFSCEAYNGPCDDIPYGGQSDMPVGEFWAPSKGLFQTCKGMASAAHVYGKPVVGAEAFTSGARERGQEHPGSIKALGDEALCAGINRFFFHRFVHQPWAEERRPGMGMGPFGIHYDRTQTWWEWTAGWHAYLARCQLLLQQGQFVADLCYLQPEVPPQRVGNHPRAGYDWDECTADAVLTRMSVKEGRLVLPDGMSYRMLVLSDSRTMTPHLLRKIRKLVKAGATVLGPKPLTSPSLSDYPACDEEVKRLAGELWGECDGDRIKEHRFGNGRVAWGETPEQTLLRAGVPADFASTQPLNHIHRRDGDTEIYFVANPQSNEVAVTCSFRVAGKRPELWRPEDGRIQQASAYEETNGCTRVPVRFDPGGSVFVVFRKQRTEGEEQRTASTSSELKPVTEITGPWEVSFDPKWGGPAKPVIFKDLSVWSDQSDPGIRYYSGTAVYRKVFNLPEPRTLNPGSSLFLDLGRVAVMAKVTLNGKELGILWKPPFRVDITDAVKPGDNQLDVSVVNLWPNRLIGDELLPEDSERQSAALHEHHPSGLIKAWPQWLKDGKPSPTGRYTFVMWRLWKKDDALLESGLLGPVRLCVSEATFSKEMQKQTEPLIIRGGR